MARMIQFNTCPSVGYICQCSESSERVYLNGLLLSIIYHFKLTSVAFNSNTYSIFPKAPDWILRKVVGAIKTHPGLRHRGLWVGGYKQMLSSDRA